MSSATGGLERVTEVPIYRSDALVRRSQPLQETTDSRPPKARMAAATLAGLVVQSGDAVRVASQQGQIVLAAQADNTVALTCVRIAAAFDETSALVLGFCQLTLYLAYCSFLHFLLTFFIAHVLSPFTLSL